MPNWCSNHTTVQGDPALISELTTRVIKPDPLAHGELMFDFNGIFPTPESLHLPEGSESIQDPCPDEQYRAFALANFGIEDIEEDDDED